MTSLNDVIGRQEDWANFITSVDEHDTNFTSWLRTGSKPVTELLNYQMDKYDAPKINARVDGKPTTVFDRTGKNRREAQARIQWFEETAAVSLKTKEFSNAAGVADEMAREIPKKMVIMKRDLECALLSDQEAFIDNNETGDKTRGVFRWIQSTAQSIYPVDELYRPPSTVIYAGTKADLNENALRDILNARYKITGTRASARMFCGIQLKTRLSDWVHYIPSNLATQRTAVVSNRDYASKKLGHTVDFYECDGGSVEVEVNNWIHNVAFSASTTLGDWSGVILDPDMWEIRWHTKPTVWKPAFDGGSYKAAMYMIMMLVCKNPQAQAKIQPNDA